MAAQLEQLIWSGRPSQVVNLDTFAICGTIAAAITSMSIVLVFYFDNPAGLIFLACPAVCLLYSLSKWLDVHFTQYEVTTQRLRFIRGFLSRRTDELELYRIKDTALVEPFFLRLFSLASIRLVSSDRTSPRCTIHAIPLDKARWLRETVRRQVEYLRSIKGVREIDSV